MFTALLAKATEPKVDILSLQAGDDSEGAYDARSLASQVVYEFQRKFLGDVLDGSNKDPLVNNPGRYLRLSKSNPAMSGDPKKALSLLCDSLPKIKTSETAASCIDYIMTILWKKHKDRERQNQEYIAESGSIDLYHLRVLISSFLDQGFGGAALVIVATALFRIMFPDKQVVPHPVYQSGASHSQFSDLDVIKEGVPYLGVELKDKAFTPTDVDHAASTAKQAGARRLLFVAGRHSSFASNPLTYFKDIRDRNMAAGMAVGVTSIDSLLDTVFSCCEFVLASLIDTTKKIGSVEAQMWIYSKMNYLNAPGNLDPIW